MNAFSGIDLKLHAGLYASFTGTDNGEVWGTRPDGTSDYIVTVCDGSAARICAGLLEAAQSHLDTFKMSVAAYTRPAEKS